MQIPDEALFTIMLYADDKTLRRIATTSTQGYKIYNDAYFLNQKAFIEPNADNFMNVNRAKHCFRFDQMISLRDYALFHGVMSTCNIPTVIIDNEKYDYLDEYILPPRTPYDTMDDYDHDEFIYHDTCSLKELYDELDDIAKKIKIFKK
jgi:hypothetical protein